jgi:hypothetical protein
MVLIISKAYNSLKWKQVELPKFHLCHRSVSNYCSLAANFRFSDSGISGGGGRGRRSQTFTASYMNHWAAVKVPIIMILGARPFHKPVKWIKVNYTIYLINALWDWMHSPTFKYLPYSGQYSQHFTNYKITTKMKTFPVFIKHSSQKKKKKKKKKRAHILIVF